MKCAGKEIEALKRYASSHRFVTSSLLLPSFGIGATL
jgi:hypothetical protein